MAGKEGNPLNFDSDAIDDLLEEEEHNLAQQTTPDMFSSRTVQLNTSDIAAQKSPGRMIGNVTIRLHTKQAHRLFHGRRRDVAKKQEPITGLIRFAGIMNRIWVAAGHDDPYADYFLFQIEQILDKAEQYIQEQTEELEQKIQSLEKKGYTIQVQESVEPVELDLKFAPEFTHKAAMVLLNFDYLVRLALSLRHAAALNRKDWNFVVNNSGKNLRHALETSLRFKQTGVTRDDIAANNAKAIDAADKLKIALPKPILEGIIRAEISPPLPAKRTATLDNEPGATIEPKQ